VEPVEGGGLYSAVSSRDHVVLGDAAGLGRYREIIRRGVLIKERNEM